MVSFSLKVLAKFGLCSSCSQKLHECSLARARKIFATARMLAISFKCARLLEISLILLCSYFLYINDKSVMIWLKQKGWNILTFGFSLSSIAQPVTVVEALCVLSGKRTKLHDNYFVYWFILYVNLSYFIVAGFLLEIGTVPLFRYMNFHIFTSFFTTDLWVYYELTTWPSPSWLDSSVTRVLHQYRRGRGFWSRSGLI